MTKKDYELIASAIADTRANSAFADCMEFQHALNKLTMTLGSEFSKSNPRFDYDKFTLATHATK